METATIQDNLHEIAAGFGLPQAHVEPLGNGLIHYTYKASENGRAIVLQQINTKVFANPQSLIGNYLVVYNFLEQGARIKIPAPIPATNGEWLLKDPQGNYWRATEYIQNSYTADATESAGAAYTTAACFGRFTSSLSGLDLMQLEVLLANFHDLSYRYHQFEEVVANTQGMRLMRSTHVIAELRQRRHLVDFYESIKNNPAYPFRLMHHDCKIGNILFDAASREVICPIDLDTIMPGKYFSDLGDMLRTMATTVDENSREWELIDVRGEFYNAIVQGYLDGIGQELSEEEKANIHKSGLLMTFMQTLRFVTDFLQGDIYYRTTDPEHNLNRALNQLILLEKMEDFLAAEGVKSKT
jgi:hypothetical protein